MKDNSSGFDASLLVDFGPRYFGGFFFIELADDEQVGSWLLDKKHGWAFQQGADGLDEFGRMHAVDDPVVKRG